MHPRAFAGSSESESRMSFLKEFLAFLSERKKYWLLPIIIVIVLLGGLLIVAQSTAMAPFIYTLF